MYGIGDLPIHLYLTKLTYFIYGYGHYVSGRIHIVHKYLPGDRWLTNAYSDLIYLTNRIDFI